MIDLLNQVIQYLNKNPGNEKYIIMIFTLVLLILFFSSIVAYKKYKSIQQLINYLPFIKKEYIVFANFSKKEGNINEIRKSYVETGCKLYELKSFRKFTKDGSITKAELEQIIINQQEKINKAKRLMKNKNSLIYIGFPHVPLGFLDGVNFSDIDSPILYEYQGMSTECLGKGFFELKHIYNSTLNLKCDLDKFTKLDNEVALKIEQSFHINNDDINKVVKVGNILTFGTNDVGRWRITNYAQIEIYKREFLNILEDLKDRGVVKIYLFAATPVSLSFSLGSVIEHYHPEVIVYNYNNGTFDWGINLRTQQVVYLSK